MMSITLPDCHNPRKVAASWFSDEDGAPILPVNAVGNKPWGIPMNRLITGLTLLLTLSATAANATILSGRFGLSSYLWERSEIDTSDTRHLQNSGTFGLRLGQIGGRDLEVSTSMRGTLDSRGQGDNVNDYRVYDLVARWRKLAKRADLSFGRHRIGWPNSSLSIDGGSAVVHLPYGYEAGGYIGSLAPEDGRFKTTDFDKGHAFGLRVGHRCATFGTVYLSFAERRQSKSYADRELNTLAWRTYALDWRRPITGFGSVYGDLLYDQPRARLARAQLSARWDMTPRVSVNGQFRYRRPTIPYNSIFWVFGESEYTEGRLRLLVRLNPSLQLTVGGSYVDVTGDHATRYDLGLTHRYVSALLSGKTGASGTTTALSADVMYPLNPKWTIRGGSHYSFAYELYEDQEDNNSEASFWAGVQWQWLPMATWDIETQFLTQNIKTDPLFAGDKSDFRVIVRFSWWFFRRLGAPPDAAAAKPVGNL